ncbi:MAG: Ig-like domain-containing protein [Staphylococcus sp.]|nr:Ig-like domain-containing protein [Staphylococcus sp.]
MKKFIFIIASFVVGLGSLSAATRYKGDLNNDDRVDLADMMILAKAIIGGNTDKDIHDLNTSGNVDDMDLHYLADIILSEKLLPNTGLNIGIGGWDDSSEDFGGSVGAPIRPGNSRVSRSAALSFTLTQPAYDFSRGLPYTNLGLDGNSDNNCGILVNITLQYDMTMPSSDMIVLPDELQNQGFKLYGTPRVTTENAYPTLRFIVFSPTLSPMPVGEVNLGKLYFNNRENCYGNANFSKCHIVNINGNDTPLPDQSSQFYEWFVRPITAISIDMSSIPEEIHVNNHFSLKVGITPDNATNQRLKWTSSNPEIAVVDENGWVEAKAIGETTVTVTTLDGSDLSASVVLTVKPIPVSSITISQESAELILGKESTLYLNVDIQPWNATNQSIEWTSSNPDVATVENGVVQAISIGEATITAATTDGSNLKASCHVKVSPILVEQISFDTGDSELRVGDSRRIISSVTPDDATIKTLKWNSSNPDIASIDSEGNVKALKVGETVISATATDGSGVSKSVSVSVKPALSSSLVINKTELNLLIGGKETLTATVMPESSGQQSIEWTSSNPDVATVWNGVVKAISIGEATITASTTDGSGLKASCHVTVSPILVSEIILEPETLELKIGKSSQLRAIVTPDYATNKELSWSSDDESVATVSQSGLVTILSDGSTTIRVRTTDGSNLEATCTIYGLSALTQVIADNSPIDIYDLQGRVIAKSVLTDALSNLPRGIYIIVQNNVSYKLMK